MRVLLDSWVWGGAKDEIRAAGFGVERAGDWEKNPGDEEIPARAFRERRIPVALDKDFGELAAVKGTPRGGILRLVGFSARRQALACVQALRTHGADPEAGGVAIVLPGHLRIRRMEGGGEA